MTRERRQWTEFVRRNVDARNAKQKRPRKNKPEPTRAELEAELDALVREAAEKAD
jgi:hypothetical protein